jgi:hypothetical protein
MFKHITAIAVVGCICAATVAPASAFTPQHNPVGGGMRTLVPKPLGAGSDAQQLLQKSQHPADENRIWDGNSGSIAPVTGTEQRSGTSRKPQRAGAPHSRTSASVIAGL